MKNIGRITLFHVSAEENKLNQPSFRGYIETPKGKYSVTLWSEPNAKVRGGEIFKGQIIDTGDQNE